MDGIRCRMPTVADAEAIARLHVASWLETYAGIVPASVLDNVDVEDRIARWRGYLDGDGVTVLAEVEGAAAGFIRAGALPEPLVDGADGHIFALYVLRRHHRQGIGRRLLGLAAKAWRPGAVSGRPDRERTGGCLLSGRGGGLRAS